MTGSTLYRRLPDGTWTAEREDAAPVRREPLEVAVPGAVADMPSAAPAPVGHGDSPQAGATGPAGRDGSAQETAPGRSSGSARTSRRQDSGRAAQGRAAQGRAAQGRGTQGRARVKRGTRWLRILKWAVVSYLVWIVGLLIYGAVTLPKTDALAANQIANTPGANWLLVGSDSREGLTAEEQRELHTGDEVGQRTDTIMVVHMGLTGAPKLISVPRDSWVTIPAHTTSSGEQVPAQAGKINSAYSYGGAPLLSETVEYNTGLRVDHFMEIGFDGVVRLTDAVGGIEVCFDKAIRDEKSGLDVPAGCQTLDGRDALAWVRMRYSDPKGDLGRVERQQQYVAAVVDELLGWQTLVNPVRQWRLVNAVTRAVEVDEGSGVIDLGRFGIGMGRIATGGGEVTTVPVSDTDHWQAGQWVLKWDTAEANELFTSIGGTTPPAQAQ